MMTDGEKKKKSDWSINLKIEIRNSEFEWVELAAYA